jgi:hypothetical protein
LFATRTVKSRDNQSVHVVDVFHIFVHHQLPTPCLDVLESGPCMRSCLRGLGNGRKSTCVFWGCRWRSLLKSSFLTALSLQRRSVENPHSTREGLDLARVVYDLSHFCVLCSPTCISVLQQSSSLLVCLLCSVADSHFVLFVSGESGRHSRQGGTAISFECLICFVETRFIADDFVS